MRHDGWIEVPVDRRISRQASLGHCRSWPRKNESSTTAPVQFGRFDGVSSCVPGRGQTMGGGLY